LLMREACDLIARDLSALMEAVRERAFQHKDTPMIGRTHGVHAEPMTFGLKMALWHAELQRDLVRVERARQTISVGKLSGAVGTVALWHERDISHSSVERVIIPDSFLALDHMLRRFADIVKGMTVNTDRMRRNLDSTKGLVFSGQLLLELTARGMRREDAYRVVQAHAMEAWRTDGDFRRRVAADPDVKKVLSAAELAEVFRLERYLG